MLPADGVAVLNEAIFRIELATGLKYKYSGATSAIPFRTTPGKEQDKKANLSVAWSTPDTDASNLAGGVLARGGFSKAQWVAKRKTYKLTKTGLLMDASDTYEDRGLRQRRWPGRRAHARAHARGRARPQQRPAADHVPVHRPDPPAALRRR